MAKWLDEQPDGPSQTVQQLIAEKMRGENKRQPDIQATLNAVENEETQATLLKRFNELPKELQEKALDKIPQNRGITWPKFWKFDKEYRLLAAKIARADGAI